jgi:hypothetical protein
MKIFIALERYRSAQSDAVLVHGTSGCGEAPCRVMGVSASAPFGMSFYRLSITVTSLALVVLGVAIVVQTARAGGGIVGYLLGPLFAAAGLGRLYLARRH